MHAAAEWVRTALGVAALNDPTCAAACGDLLDVLGGHLDTLPLPVRAHTVRVCRELIGDPMDQPTRRRTRRR